MSGALAINTIITHTPQVEAEVPDVPEAIMRDARAFEEQGAQQEEEFPSSSLCY
jgi:hypothetical protein